MSQPQQVPHEGTIRTLCLQNGIDILRLSDESSIHPLVIWDLFLGYPQPEHVKAVALSAINRIAGTQHTDAGT